MSRRSLLWSGLWGAGVALGLPLACRRIETATRSSGEPPSRSSETAVDTVFVGGTIITMDDALPRAEALAIRGGKIVAVGSRAEVLAGRESSTRVIDLDGRAVLPGFVEPHGHPLGVASTAEWIDVGVILSGATSIRHALEKIRAATAKAPPGTWIRARLVDPMLRSDKIELSARDLDPVAPHHPVFLLNASGHLAFVNSKALDVAGIHRTSKDPTQGRYKRDGNGRPTGVLEATPAFKAFFKAMPRPTTAELQRALRAVLDRSAATGFTSVNDAGVGLATGTKDIELLEHVVRIGAPVRMTGLLVASLFDEWMGLGLTPGHGDDALRFIGMKDWSALAKVPFLRWGERNEGAAHLDLAEGMQRAHDAGWQISAHANDDAAIDRTLAAYEAILRKTPRSDHRHRIEHESFARPEHIAKMKQLGVSPSFSIGQDEAHGREGGGHVDPTAAAVNAGLRWSMHSNYGVRPIAPLRYVENAVMRIMRETEDVPGSEQRFPIVAALKAVTIHAAYQCRRDHLVGSIAAGKRADLVILDMDPTATSPSRLGAIQVLETWIDGAKRFTG